MTGRLSAGAAFGLGVVAGLFLKEGMQRMQNVARRKLAHHEHQHTLAFDENLPDALERREPEPQPGQPRFGGTGAIGISPAAVKTSPR
jgi:hypothetical protein